MRDDGPELLQLYDSLKAPCGAPFSASLNCSFNLQEAQLSDFHWFQQLWPGVHGFGDDFADLRGRHIALFCQSPRPMFHTIGSVLPTL